MIDQRLLNELKSSINSLRTRLPINPTELEKVCVDQPILYDEICQLVVEWSANAKSASERVAFIKADQSSKIRTSPENYGVSKVTEGSVESATILTKEYQEAVKEQIETEKVYGQLRGLQSSIEQRKSSINNLVELWVKDYYSKINGDTTTERKALTGVTEQDIVNTRIKNAEKRAEAENDLPRNLAAD